MTPTQRSLAKLRQEGYRDCFRAESMTAHFSRELTKFSMKELSELTTWRTDAVKRLGERLCEIAGEHLDEEPRATVH